ncbi:aminoglycoside phosphotransferase [Caulobacter sp. AP07]|uniref:APH(3')-I family aminoglycoside O-phosphotransferase n=1 Tax=Caulobacter sp. AP07 TaxID=1144304 RepID=UPI00027215C3|nr:APH(3')-I family aminoglycoside O-phosphotransferase [Caulobacter sp. AP07]EJL36748.1 aminoglycoside phosphotransferase [Caulobacter sp. AP07]
MADEQREESCAPVAAPASMARDVRGYLWARDKVGESGGEVYRLHGHPRARALFLKRGEGAVADEITDEMARLVWLKSYLPAPEVVHFTRAQGEAWLLMTAVPGRTAYQMLRDGAGEAVIDALASFMRRLHGIPVETCPFNSDHGLRLSLARARIDANLVDSDDFDDEREGWTAEDVWAEIQRLPPQAYDRVVTHGDFSLDNLIINDGEVAGCIDVGRLGVADRYQDIAILWNNLDEFGGRLQTRLLEKYGLEDIDEPKLRFHLLMDELF